MKYLVNSLLWSRQHNAYFQPGDTIEFKPNPTPPADGGDLPADAIVVDVDLLVKMGVITPVQAAQAGPAAGDAPEILKAPKKESK